ncbi:hypothetical protein RDABS01_017889 [Bienertia sinuspersici]
MWWWCSTNNTRRFMRAFIANLSTCSLYKAEIMAIMFRLELAQDIGSQKLEVQMDNEACVEVLKNPHYQGGECYHLINRCRQLLNSNTWDIRLIHCYREGNKVKNKLAILGVNQVYRLLVHHSPPNEIVSLLREDTLGVISLRLV